MRRTVEVVGVLLIVLFALTLVGCGGGSQSPSVTDIDRGKPTPPPTPCKIAFVGQPKGRSMFQIYTMNTDGTGAKQITPTGLVPNISPSWSPDGTRICFTTEGTNWRQVCTMNNDGSNRVPLSTPPADVGDDAPDWCPSSTVNKIVFSRSTPGNTGMDNLWTVDVATGDEEQLTFGTPPNDCWASWSPDGQFVVFRRNNAVAPDTNGLHVVRVSDGAVWDLGISASQPDWSPQGNKIAYGKSGYVWYLPVDPATGQATGSPVQVTQTAYQAADHPTWSPDGAYIVFRAFQAESPTLRKVEVATGTDQSLGRDGWDADWSPVLP